MSLKDEMMAKYKGSEDLSWMEPFWDESCTVCSLPWGSHVESASPDLPHAAARLAWVARLLRANPLVSEAVTDVLPDLERAAEALAKVAEV